MDAALLLGVFDQRVAAWQHQWQRCQTRLDEKAVHDLRVAIRRLLALLDLLRSPGFALRGGKLRRALKSQLASLSRLRDIQVMLGETARQLPAGRSRRVFLEQLRELERCERDQVARALAGGSPDRLARRLARQRRRLARVEHDCADGWQVALNAAWARLWRCHDRAHRGTLVSIHRERIACKRYRYCVEILASVAPATVSRASLQLLRDYQTRLGAIQDAQVLQASLQRHRSTASGAALYRAAGDLCDERVAAYRRQRDSLAALQLPFVR